MGRKSELSIAFKAGLLDGLPDVLPAGLPGNPELAGTVVAADWAGVGFCGLKPAAARLLDWLVN